MRTLLSASPFLSPAAREAVAARSESARRELVQLGVNECEALELLDERAPKPGDHALLDPCIGR